MNEKRRAEDLSIGLCMLSWTGAGEELRMGEGGRGGFYILLLGGYRGMILEKEPALDL